MAHLVMMRFGRRHLDGEVGSILPLMAGMLALVMVVMSGLVGMAQLVHERRALHQLGDEVVLAAVTALDHDRYYTDGAGTAVPLSEAEIERFLRGWSELAGVRVESMSVSGDEVALVLSRQVSLAWGLSRQVQVSVAARPLADPH